MRCQTSKDIFIRHLPSCKDIEQRRLTAGTVAPVVNQPLYATAITRRDVQQHQLALGRLGSSAKSRHRVEELERPIVVRGISKAPPPSEFPTTAQFEAGMRVREAAESSVCVLRSVSGYSETGGS